MREQRRPGLWFVISTVLIVGTGCSGILDLFSKPALHANPCVTAKVEQVPMQTTIKAPATPTTGPTSGGSPLGPSAPTVTLSGTPSATSQAWPPPPENMAFVMPPSAAVTIQSLYDADSMHMMPPEVDSFATKNNWCTAAIPEFQDVQRFVQRNHTVISGVTDDYGPIVQVIAAPHLSTYNHSNEFEPQFVFVAIAYVWDNPEAMRDPYDRLHLTKGLNCVYLKHVATGWTARVLHGNSDGCHHAEPSIAAAPSIETVPEDSSHTGEPIPPVARFVQSGDSATFIGLRCGAYWCNIGAPDSRWIPAPTHPMAPGSSSRYVVKGWFDDQQVAIQSRGTPPLTAYKFASVVPVDSLSDIKATSFGAGFVPVANVFLSDSITYYQKQFGFTAGWNKIALMGKTDDERWIAKITDSQNKDHIRYVKRFAHTMGAIPGTARWAWRWRDRDEWIWIACEVGCCLIQGGGDIS